MKSRDLRFALQWLEKAQHDMITAAHVLALPDGPTDTPCFHAQQAVEKVLKGLLTAHSVRFERVHDLLPLLDAAELHVPALGGERHVVAELSEYAVGVRYPSGEPEPPREDAHRAVDAATRIVNVVRAHVDDLVRGCPGSDESA